MGTWPDLIHFSQPLLFPGFKMKQALVLHSLPVKHPVGLIKSLWVELDQLEPTEEQWEGEGTAVWEEDGVSGAGVGCFMGQSSIKGSDIVSVCGNARESEPCANTCLFNMLCKHLKSSSTPKR